MVAAGPARLGDRHRGLGGDRRLGDRPARWCRSRATSPRTPGCRRSPARTSCPVLFVGLAAILSFVFSAPTRTSSRTRDARAAATGATRHDAAGVAILRRPGGARRDHRARRGPVRDGPDHDDDPAPHDRARPRPRRRSGIVLSAHTLGMFALSPISGRLTDRFGAVPTIFAGTRPLAIAAVMAAVAPPDGGVMLAPRAVPARARLEPRVRRRARDALAAPRAPRADAGPGRRRRADLERPRAAASLGSGLIMAARRLHGARDPRRGRGDHPGARAPRRTGAAMRHAHAAEVAPTA